MRERQKMQTFDWFNWAGLFVIGVLLGLVIDGMVDLASTGSWRSIIVIIVLFGGWFIFYLLMERVFNLFSIGRWSAPRQLQKPRKPLALHFALPIGIAIGVIGAQFGLADMIA